MSLTNTYREVGIERSKKQPTLINDLIEEAPILANMPVEDSTDQLHNVYEEIESVTAAQVVDGDEALPVVNATTNLKQVDLSIIGGIIECGEDKAKAFGSAGAYFAKKQSPIFRETGSQLEQSIIYNSLRAFAATNSKLQDAGGTTTNKQNSILAVTWMPGEITGLLSPNGFGNKEIMDVLAINGGNLYKDSDGVLVYGMRYKSYLGVQLANARYVSGIANIEITDADPDNWSIPSEEDIEIMLEDCRANDNTMIYCHPKVWRLVLSKYKAASLRTFAETSDYNRLISAWDTTPIMTSRNFRVDAEAVVA